MNKPTGDRDQANQSIYQSQALYEILDILQNIYKKNLEDSEFTKTCFDWSKENFNKAWTTVGRGQGKAGAGEKKEQQRVYDSSEYGNWLNYYNLTLEQFDWPKYRGLEILKDFEWSKGFGSFKVKNVESWVAGNKWKPALNDYPYPNIYYGTFRTPNLDYKPEAGSEIGEAPPNNQELTDATVALIKRSCILDKMVNNLKKTLHDIRIEITKLAETDDVKLKNIRRLLNNND